MKAGFITISLKELGAQHFSDDEEVKQAVKNWLKAQLTKFASLAYMPLFIDGQLSLRKTERLH